jgi:hypothetical protein
MGEIIIGLENIHRRFFVDSKGKELFCFGTFKRKYLKELYRKEVIQYCSTIAGASAFTEEIVFIQWKRKKFNHPKFS